MMMIVLHVLQEDFYKMEIVEQIVMELTSQIQILENVKVAILHAQLVMDQLQAIVIVVVQENISGMVYVMDHALQELMDHGYGENAMLAMLSVKHVLEILKMNV